MFIYAILCFSYKKYLILLKTAFQIKFSRHHGYCDEKQNYNFFVQVLLIIQFTSYNLTNETHNNFSYILSYTNILECRENI